jgi:predicted DNA-binding transcriptional regulator YafY
MQINRLFEMVYILMDRKKMTAKELSDHFEVSQRTIYRDIDVLGSSGIPVSANKGKGGGIELLDDFMLNKSAFSKQEQNEIVFALQSFRSLKAVNADSVLKKLSAIFNKDAINWIDVDFSEWSADGKEKFDTVKSAILDKRCLSFDYFGTNGEKTHRSVYPMQLWFKHRAWYVKAFCLMRRDYRLFKMSRVKNLSVSSGESNFEIADLFELEIIQPNTRNKSGDFYYEDSEGAVFAEQKTKNQKNNVDLTLLVDSSLAHKVFDEFDEKEIKTDENGNFIINAIFPEDEWLYGYILSFGQNAEVLEPLYFRDKVIDKLQKTLMKYL